jgi:uncharacterized 2Fe-2S/4Fe-4S cluster protein (DUF4445 family)
MSFPMKVAIAAAVGAFVPLALAQTHGSLPDLRSLVSDAGETGTACAIKGNISINTGERIYHVPGQEHYDETIISPQHGERWFCTETEARAAGWRRARR